ncbi:hypothetical protein [Bailinhaonella thermotolerans]|uniref:Uncharacterized protein n=1 Tax=Bailinhaonella thermotolerans TaxID=1070861 RepID=A0A3A4A5H2_9ACTN|nr:hypothetical protein [Bailinhaonella thermotolerans]RJL19745.1 hypothetical protein D5H75_40170 [Bailinhaonella thermotolerans]
MPHPPALTATARAYLRNLARTARRAEHEVRAAELACEALSLEPPSGAEATTGAGAAATSPWHVTSERRRERAEARLRASREDLAQIAWWYTTAAAAAVSALRHGGDITAADLEARTLYRRDRRPGRGYDQDPGGPPWRAWNRPQLPDPDAVAVGIADLDEPVRDAVTTLRGAYAAAQTAELMYSTELGDSPPETRTPHGAQQRDEAEKIAQLIPEMLVCLAAALAHAALGDEVSANTGAHV